MLYSIQLFDCMKQLLLLLILYNGIYTRTYGYLLLDILRTGTRISSVNNRCRNLHGWHERQRQVLEAVKTKHNDQYVQQDGHYMVFDKGLCEFHARLALPAVCGVRGDDMHGCTVRQIGLTLGNNPVARLEAETISVESW